jgi:hypothetical protein
MKPELIFEKAFFCAPAQAIISQEVRVIIAYIDKHRDQMRRFEELALRALGETWPCR